MGAETTGPRGPPIELAIEAELYQFERYSIRLWQIVAALCVLASIVVALTIDFDLGMAAGILAAFYLAWTLPAAWRLESAQRVPIWVRYGIDAVEASAPWTFFLVISLVQGADYALASWVPPMLFCMILLQNTLRLRQVAPIVLGVAGGVSFFAIYVFVVRERVPDALASHVLFEAPMQLVRSATLVLGGMLAALGARTFRRALLRAEGHVRAKELFGKYRLKDKIARGGMGEVMEAVYCPEGGFERRVAIKRIHPHLAEQERFVTQFRTEAELCARLAHPNIVQVLDFGRIEDTYFLAMDLVDGMTLARLLKCAYERELSLPEHVVGTIARQICEGLHYAHVLARGSDGEPLRVVHRDMCPQNVLVSVNGEVKISDFGVARALKDAESSHTRNVVGHTAYMAPEQARAEAIDPRSDLFGVGVTIWELLAVRRLFQRDTEAATLQALMNAPIPSIQSERPDCHPDWDALLKRALAREPDERFQSAQELMTALDDIPTSRGEGASRQLATMIELLGDDESQGELRAIPEPKDTLVETPSGLRE